MQPSLSITLRNNPIEVAIRVMEYMHANPTATREHIVHDLDSLEIKSPQYVSALAAIARWPADIKDFCRERRYAFSKLRDLAAEKNFEKIKEQLGMDKSNVLQHPTSSKLAEIETAVSGFQQDLKSLDSEQAEMHQKIDAISETMESFKMELQQLRKLAATTLDLPRLREEIRSEIFSQYEEMKQEQDRHLSSLNAHMTKSACDVTEAIGALRIELSSIRSDIGEMPIEVSHHNNGRPSDTKFVSRKKSAPAHEMIAWLKGMTPGVVLFRIVMLAAYILVVNNNLHFFGRDWIGATQAVMIETALFSCGLILPLCRTKFSLVACGLAIVGLIYVNYEIMSSALDARAKTQSAAYAGQIATATKAAADQDSVVRTIRLRLAETEKQLLTLQDQQKKAFDEGRIRAGNRMKPDIDAGIESVKTIGKELELKVLEIEQSVRKQIPQLVESRSTGNSSLQYTSLALIIFGPLMLAGVHRPKDV